MQWIRLLSFLLFAGSLVLPAFRQGEVICQGWYALAMGAAPLVYGVFHPATNLFFHHLSWLANPIYIAALSESKEPTALERKIKTVLSLGALLLALQFLSIDRFEGWFGQNRIPAEPLTGYYVWLSAIGITTALRVFQLIRARGDKPEELTEPVA